MTTQSLSESHAMVSGSKDGSRTLHQLAEQDFCQVISGSVPGLAAHDGTHEWASRTPARGAISPERRQKTEFGGNIETLWPTQPFTPILPPVNLVATDDEGRHTVRNQRTGPFTLPVQDKSFTSVQPKGFDTAERREPGVRICRIVDGRLQSLSGNSLSFGLCRS